MKPQNKTNPNSTTNQKVQGVRDFAEWLENCGMDLTHQQVIEIAKKWQPDSMDTTGEMRK